jgi:GNAT superfamily N-acetyltransferase
MEFRNAVAGDLPAIVKLLADDELGAMRERDEDPLPREYRDAFAAMERAREQGCGLVQLTTDRARGDAHRFYERLGFEASHLGMKLDLTKGAKTTT